MLNLPVSALVAEKGIEYAGIFQRGNSFYIPKGVRISINRSPFSTFRDEILLVHPEFTYAFEHKTTVSLYLSINPELEQVFESVCPAVIDLVSGTESDKICALTMPEELKLGKGTISAVAYVDNTSNSNRDIKINLYVDGVKAKTNTVRVLKRSIKGVAISIPAIAIASGKEVTFKLEANGNKCEVVGAIFPSIVKVEKIL